MKFRHEYKHRINTADILILRSRLSAVAERDKYAGADGTYVIKNLYFDNYADTALREKTDGTDKREKFRIRYYGTDKSFIRLEKKSKINGLCSKEGTRITEEECRKIINGDTCFMLESGNNLLCELYAKMKYRLLRPKCVVVYKRESFVYPAGNVRITIDTDISASNACADFLNDDLIPCRASSDNILEVKWDEYLPEIIRSATGLKYRRASAFSKYAAARLLY